MKPIANTPSQKPKLRTQYIHFVCIFDAFFMHLLRIIMHILCIFHCLCISYANFMHFLSIFDAFYCSLQEYRMTLIIHAYSFLLHYGFLNLTPLQWEFKFIGGSILVCISHHLAGNIYYNAIIISIQESNYGSDIMVSWLQTLDICNINCKVCFYN